jgi:hypothetical protein
MHAWSTKAVLNNTSHGAERGGSLTCVALPCSAAAGEGGGKAKGLPSGVALADLVPAKVEAIPATHDAGNPELGCEFFETRQVRGGVPFSAAHTAVTASACTIFGVHAGKCEGSCQACL